MKNCRFLLVIGSLLISASLVGMEGKPSDKIEITIDGFTRSFDKNKVVFQGGIESFRMPIAIKGSTFVDIAQALGQHGLITLRADGENALLVQMESKYGPAVWPYERRAVETRAQNAEALSWRDSCMNIYVPLMLWASFMIYMATLPYLVAH